MALRKLNVPSPTVGVREAAGALVRPLGLERAEAACAALTGEPHAVLFASARGAIAAAAACVAGTREVTMPAYTCIAVANGMRSAGVPYGFVDVSPDGTAPAAAFAGAEVALVQDTYGFAAEVPAGVDAIRDCAHRADLLHAGDVAVAVTSFEHSKWLSAGRGGLAVTRDADLARRMRDWRDRTPPPGRADRLRHGLSTLVLLALGRLLFAGRLPRAAQALAIAADVLAPSAMAGQSIDELGGQGVGRDALGAPNGTVCRLAVTQLRSSAAVAAHRAGIVAVYDAAAGIEREPLPLVRYPLTVDDVAAFEAALAAAGFDAEGRWFDAPLHPGASDPAAFGYRWGSAPAAEALSEHVVNLPTHTLLSVADARALIASALSVGAKPLTRS